MFTSQGSLVGCRRGGVGLRARVSRDKYSGGCELGWREYGGGRSGSGGERALRPAPASRLPHPAPALASPTTHLQHQHQLHGTAPSNWAHRFRRCSPVEPLAILPANIFMIVIVMIDDDLTTHLSNPRLLSTTFSKLKLKSVYWK